jgi:hypothetical protein
MSSSAHADGTGTRLVLNARGDGVSCDDPAEPTECTVPLAGAFTLAVDLLEPPDDGYITIATTVSFPGLTWTPAATADETVWPDGAFPIRSPEAPGFNTQVLAHGDLTATSPPLPVSHYEGSVVAITLNCTAEDDSFEVALVNYDPAAAPLGSQVTLPDADGTIVSGKTVGERDVDLNNEGIPQTVPVTDLLTINCEEVPPTPTPTTGEGEAPTATPVLPITGFGADQSGAGARSWLIAGVLAAAAGFLTLSGWRVAQRRAK